MLRIGVLGAAGIAPQALLRPARRRDDLAVVAVASRSAGRAGSYAAEHGIATSYGSYEELVADPAVDVVYNALPPSEHVAWTIEALGAGKHVLCEKPAAMTADEARAMVAAATDAGRRLLEAFHDHHHPLTAHVRALVASGALGEVDRVEGAFATVNPFDPGSIRHDPAVGGGALMDLGCYPVHWVRSVTGEEPEVVSATASANPLGADDTIEATLRFPSGIEGRVYASMSPAQRVASLVVHGSRGSLEVDNPVLPHRGHSVRTTVDGVSRTTTVGGQETYDHQLDALVRAVVHGEAVGTEGADIVANMTVIDAIYHAAGWRRPPREEAR